MKKIETVFRKMIKLFQSEYEYETFIAIVNNLDYSSSKAKNHKEVTNNYGI